tara:strand:- start:4027 stop:5151 length:1125 start_codon:yes stop_codon:yes gene_type:complete
VQTLLEITAFSGIAFSFFLILLLVLKSEKGRADFILMGWFVGIMVHCIYFYLTVMGKAESNQLIQSIGSALPVLHIPVFYLYTKELVEKNSYQSWVIGFSPFIIYLLFFYVAISNQLLFYDRFELFISGGAPFWVGLISPLMIFIVIVFIWFIRKLIQKQMFLVRQHFSYETKSTLEWVNYWLVTLGIGALVIVITILLADSGLYSYSVSYSITFLLIDVQLLFVGIYGLKQTTFFLNKLPIVDVDEPKLKYEKSSLKDEDSEIIIQKLYTAMKDDRLYLNPELTITNLADQIGHSKVLISQTLNQKLGVNFFDFVNKYRVEEVKLLLDNSENDHLSILGIAMEAGFSSKSTFNKCFKKFTGYTPSNYKKNLGK